MTEKKRGQTFPSDRRGVGGGRRGREREKKRALAELDLHLDNYRAVVLVPAE